MSETKAMREQEDMLLQMLVAIADTQDVAIGITIYTGAGTITGQLIGGKKYFDTFAEQMSSGFKQIGVSDVTAKAMREQLAQPGESFYGDKADKTKPVYLHLKNARYLSGGTAYESAGALWRGRISNVQGFTLGMAEAVKG
jgi:hypothetical protein